MPRAPRVILSTTKFAVEERHVLRGGLELTRHIVVHPGAAVILPLLDDGRVVLIRNQRVSVGRALLELPAGTLEPGEAPIVAAARELEEETGYAAGSVEPLLEFLASPGICDERMYVFVARGLQKRAQRLDPGELIDPVVLDWEDALAAIADGRIEDGKTISSLLYFERFGRKEPPGNAR